MADIICPECGARPDVDRDFLYRLTETAVPSLVAFFAQKLDQVHCKVCGHALEVLPTLAVMFINPPALLVALGSLAETHRAEYSRLLQELSPLAQDQIIPEEFSSFDALRAAVAQRLQPRFESLNALTRARAQGELANHIRTNWRTLTPEVFAAGQLLCEAIAQHVRLPGMLLLSTANEFSSAAWLQHFAAAQALVVGGLSDWWSGSGAPDHTLEEDLQRFIDPGVFLGRAPEMVLEALDRLAQEDAQQPAPARFCREAIRASLYAVAQQVNPQASQWAEQFFAHELACRLGADRVSVQVKAMTISEERARRTIGFSQAWDAVARRMSNWQPEELRVKFQVLDNIAAKAGHPELVQQVRADGRYLEGDEDIPLEVIIQQICRDAAFYDDTLGSLLIESEAYAQWLLQQGRIEDLERLADILIEGAGGTNVVRAYIDAWLGAYLKALRLPKRFFARVGETPRTWEYDLEPVVRAVLWNERANALRLLGQVEEALSLSEEIEQRCGDYLPSAFRRVLRRNIAILLRETGAPDIALEILYSLVVETPVEEIDELLDLRHSLALTHALLGQIAEAVRWLDEALRLATGALDPPRV
jgi:tetratricopeptide (TPR) repeat protein